MATKLPQDDLINIEEKLKEDYFLDSYIIVCTVLYLKMPFLFPYLMNLDLHKNVEKSIIFLVICFLSNSLFYLALKKSLHFISRRTLNIGMLHQPPHLTLCRLFNILLILVPYNASPIVVPHELRLPQKHRGMHIVFNLLFLVHHIVLLCTQEIPPLHPPLHLIYRHTSVLLHLSLDGASSRLGFTILYLACIA